MKPTKYIWKAERKVRAYENTVGGEFDQSTLYTSRALSQWKPCAQLTYTNKHANAHTHTHTHTYRKAIIENHAEMLSLVKQSEWEVTEWTASHFSLDESTGTQGCVCEAGAECKILFKIPFR
jgi:hypothetical protein